MLFKLQRMKLLSMYLENHAILLKRLLWERHFPSRQVVACHDIHKLSEWVKASKAIFGLCEYAG